MSIVAGFDVHRAQITVDVLDTATGEVRRDRVAPADRLHVRRFLKQFGGAELVVALEATTGWRFVVEELDRVGAEVHLAEPAEASTLRGTKRRAKTDRTDARHLRELVMQGRIPESWIPPEDLLELRSRVRLRKTLVDERTSWLQRIHATLFHHGVRPSVKRLQGLTARGHLGKLALPPAAVGQIEVALQLIDHINALIHPIDLELERIPSTAGLPGADGPLRDRAEGRDRDPRRAGRRATV